jgi:hypothetical protein
VSLSTESLKLRAGSARDLVLSGESLRFLVAALLGVLGP